MVAVTVHRHILPFFDKTTGFVEKISQHAIHPYAKRKPRVKSKYNIDDMTIDNEAWSSSTEQSTEETIKRAGVMIETEIGERDPYLYYWGRQESWAGEWLANFQVALKKFLFILIVLEACHPLGVTRRGSLLKLLKDGPHSSLNFNDSDIKP
jgi:hypothetical protein